MASITGFLLRRKSIREAETCALLASGAKELARPRDNAVKTTAPNTLQNKAGCYNPIGHLTQFVVSQLTNHTILLCTIDREIFTLKRIRVKNFRVVKFSQFHSILEILLMVDDCNMDEHLESSWRLVYYQVSGEPGIACCSRRSDIYPG